MALEKLYPPFRKAIKNGDYSRLIREDCEIEHKIALAEFDALQRKSGEYLDSPVYPEDCHAHFKWKIRFFPLGDGQNSKESCSCYLYLVSSRMKAPVSTVFCLSLTRDRFTTVVQRVAEDVYEECLGKGYPNFSKINKIRGMSSGNVILCAQISAHYEEKSIVSRNISYISERNLLDDYSGLLESGSFTDLVLCIKEDGSKFNVHCGILASRSKVFAAMLSNEMEESITGIVVIEDLPSSAVKDLLDFMYSCKVNFRSVKCAFDLLKASDKYQLMDLKIQCVEYLYSILDETNACEILLEADIYNLSDLKSAALKYTCENKAKFSDRKQYHYLQEENPDLMIEIIEELSKYIETMKLKT